MLRTGLVILALFWASFVMIILGFLTFARIIPSQGSILLTNNIFLDRYERFEIIDLNQQLHYHFSPDIENRTLAISLAPQGRRMAILHVIGLEYSLSIKDYAGRSLIEPIISNKSVEFGEARWSSDGRYFMFYDDGISILDTQNGLLSNIASQGTFHPSASWSRDGENIAYAYTLPAETVSQIWIADANGQKPRQLTQSEGTSYCPTWSPDGRTIAYIEELNEGDRLRYVNLDGTNNASYFSDIWQMTTCPIWLSDGRSISFVSLDINDFSTQVLIVDIISGAETAILDVEQTVSLDLWR